MRKAPAVRPRLERLARAGLITRYAELSLYPTLTPPLALSAHSILTATRPEVRESGVRVHPRRRAIARTHVQAKQVFHKKVDKSSENRYAAGMAAGDEIPDEVADIWAAVRPEFGTWQPIETAPRDNTMLLLLKFTNEEDYDGQISVGLWTNRYGGTVANDDEIWADWCVGLDDEGAWTELRPTHWMPLPMPPA